jgi:hypothetical protein
MRISNRSLGELRYNANDSSVKTIDYFILIIMDVVEHRIKEQRSENQRHIHD